MKLKLVVDREDLKVWSNGARDELIERLPDGSERWRLYRDIDDDGVFEALEVTINNGSTTTLRRV